VLTPGRPGTRRTVAGVAYRGRRPVGEYVPGMNKTVPGLLRQG
jgi:hypothetical protein